MNDEESQSSTESVLPWQKTPPRRAASIFLSGRGKGVFLREIDAAKKPKSTRADNSVGLSRLVEGSPVVGPRGGIVQVPQVHRPASITPKLASPCFEGIERKPPALYPRHGTPRSLAYHSPIERMGAHAGWGPTVSLCASVPASAYGELSGAILSSLASRPASVASRPRSRAPSSTFGARSP
mmetsp:Transcript_14543/g.37615  ORF Transcript_14543/g.37615 Transcript_14543/m.37615 type:complete len:182 (-) Transcript_14543:19-564(-)